MVTDIKAIGLSYAEVEEIAEKWNPDSVVDYVGGTVRVNLVDERNGGEIIKDFAEILNRIHPEYAISPDAISIYTDMGYIYPQKDVDVVIIDGIQ